MISIKLHFGADLSDLCRGGEPDGRGGRVVVRRLPEPASRRDAIEAVGVPRCEIGDLTDAAGHALDPAGPTADSETIRVSAPAPCPIDGARFLCDVHLGKLARMLRVLGFDTSWRPVWTPSAVVRQSVNEGRIVLSGSRALLKRSALGRAMLVRPGPAEDQAAAVVARFGLAAQVRLFGRCSRCNGGLAPVAFADVAGTLPPRTARWRREYHRCADCGQLYWEGTHVEILRARLAAADLAAATPVTTLTAEVAAAGPFWRLMARLPAAAPRFLLDSAADPTHRGRWSHLGAEPAALLTGKRCAASPTLRADGTRPPRPMDLTLQTWRDPDGRRHDPPKVRTWQGDPFDALRRLQSDYRPPARPGAPSVPPGGPFTSGLVGYFGYEAAYAVEHLPDTGADDPDLPDLAFMVADDVVSHDHATGRTSISVIGRGPDHAAAVRDAQSRLDHWRALLAGGAAAADAGEVDRESSRGRRPAPSVPPAGSASGLLLPPACGGLQTPRETLPVDLTGVRCGFTAEQYAQLVEECRQRILAGDVFEVCPTQRMEMDLKAGPWELYEALREVNPAPFAAFLDFGAFQVCSASPERFLQVRGGRDVESRPIKGTRPRSGNADEDARLREDLRASEKDRAENVMIVDLLRNDLGRVCETGSVAVPELCGVESFATVHQMVSSITGRLRADRDAIDLVRACFPGGSMTGAPKVAAMAIIDAAEPVKRGVYSGAIGCLAHGGDVELSIVIRTLVCRGRAVHFGVGGAVTADSDPRDEYRETLDKARALVAAVRLANARAEKGAG